MTKPLLSASMPNYNDSETIGKALESICEQSCPPDEVIVVDDASTDSSMDVLEEYAARFKNIKIYKNDQNYGVIYTVNRCLSLANGRYFNMSSSNDILLPGCFERSMRLLEQYPQAGLCTSQLIAVELWSGVESIPKDHAGYETGYFTPDQLSQLKNVNGFGFPTIYKRESLLEAGGLISDLRWHADWFAQMVVGFRYGLCYVAEPLAQMNKRQQSYSAEAWSSRFVDGQIEVVSKALDLLLADEAYKDILEKVLQLDWFSRFGINSGRVLLQLLGVRPQYWRIFLPLIIKKASQRSGFHRK